MILGVDTSFANGSPNWPQAFRDERVQFVIARACYGTNPAYDDGACFAVAHDAAKIAGKPFGSYFFYLASEDGKAQAEHFLDTADGRFGTIAPVVDVEEDSGVEGWGGSVEERIANLSAALATIEAKLGQPIIYTDPNTWATYFESTDAFAGHRFYLAHYTGVPGKFDAPEGVKNVVLHQFSDGIGLPPIAGLSKPGNNADRDALIGGDFRVLERV
jgi:lysozyme